MMSEERPRALLEVLNLAADYLKEKGVRGARLDAELLLAHILGLERIYLYVQHDRPLVRKELDAYRRAIARRAAGMPVAYITNHKEFFSHDFYVDENVLIPRPETELLVERVIDHMREVQDEQSYLLDLGTGCGVIAICTALAVPDSRAVAVDVSEPALAVARRNARCHGVSDRVEFMVSDMFSALELNTWREKFHVIASNPPYVPAGQLEHLPREVRMYEPKTALDGGEDGLAFYRRIAARAHQYLRAGGWLCLELGEGQAPAVSTMIKGTGYFSAIQVIKDYAGIDRVLVARRQGDVGN